MSLLRARRSSLIAATARSIFFATLILAPWYYGGTTAISIVVINCLLGAALLFWLAELIVNRRLPKFPKGLLITIGLILAVGALMTISARAIYDSEFGTFASIANPLPF